MSSSATSDRLIIGAMSGTSADGVDCALVRVSGHGLSMSAKLDGLHSEAFPASIRDVIFALRDGEGVGLRALAMLGRNISLKYAAACLALLKETGTQASEIAAIAAHGQTLFHDPPLTIQWFDPALLAHRTGITVVSDFRRADCASGGQGAPLVPLADYLMFRGSQPRAILNIGGIANITLLPAAASIDSIVAFDTGPGNCISDHLVRKHFGVGFDVNGAIAETGLPIGPILQRALASPYFHAPAPKSTDGPAMIELFERAVAAAGGAHPPENLLRTAAALTADSIDLAIRQYTMGPLETLIVAGGGTGNLTSMRLLRQRLGSTRVVLSDEFGVPAMAREAMAFALLGAATLDGEPGNVPSVTGASGRVILGSTTPRPSMA
jgi:anhydro-N-acetylmuramic acid kinase